MSSNDKKEKKEKEVKENVPSNKDEKKKKKDSDDKKKEKDKRRDSVTGSPLDTSSSSNSSVDSDEVDETKGTMTETSEEPKPLEEDHKMDGAFNEVIKKITAFSMKGSGGTSKPAVELNGDGDDGHKISADNNMQAKNGTVNNSNKSKKRNRKQRKKNKRNAPPHHEEAGFKAVEFSRTVEPNAPKDIFQRSADCIEGTDSSVVRVVRKQEFMNIDGMEAANLLHMTDISNKFARNFTPWIRKFYAASVNGDFKEFTNKFTCILRIIKKCSGRDRYERMTQQQFREHVMNGVISAFFDKSENTSVLHHLALTRNTDHSCDMRNHGCCSLIKMILSILPWKDRRALLATRTKRTGKTALHLAAAAGQACQMQAILDFGAWPDCIDRSGRAPIHYAIMRNDLDMVKLLLWYGADISLRERSATPWQLAGCSPTTIPLCEWLHTRVTALQNIYMQWVKKYVRGVWTPVRAISDIHFLRLSKACDTKTDAVRNLLTKNRQVNVSILETRANNPQLRKCPLMLLFIVPTFYKDDDIMADAGNPQIFCAKLQNLCGSIVRLLPARPLLSCSTWSVPIKSALEKPHNGYFYVYKLPETLGIGSYTLHLTVELEELRFQAPHIALAIQAFACGPPDLEHYNELRGLTNHSFNKSKLD